MFRTADTDYNVDRHLIKLLETSPFFAEISRHVRKVITRDLPTAGVTFDMHSDDFVMGINPDFFATLTDEEIAGILRHEYYHIVFLHVTARRKAPHMRWNVATDLAINSIILDPSSGSGVSLPDMALVPGRPLKVAGPMPTPGKPTKANVSKEYAAAAKISDLIASLPPLETSEFYFDKLSALAEELTKGCPVHGEPGGKKGTPSPGGTKQDPNGDPSSGGDDTGDQGEGGDEEGDEGPGHGQGGHGHGDEGEECTCGISSLDDHDGWDAVPEEMRDYVEGKARALTEKAAKHADSRSNGWGSVPSNIRDEIRRSVSRIVDWKAVLRQFVGSISRGERTSTVRRINRKYPYIHPGVKRGYTAKLAVAIDQSGSVGDDMLGRFFSELESLTKKVSVTVIPFDYDVNPKDVFEWRKGQRPNLKRVKGGGTSFDAPTHFVNDPKNRGKWDGVIFLTDGECGQPGPSRVKRGWILGPGCKLFFPTDEMQVSMDKGTPTKGAWR